MCTVLGDFLASVGAIGVGFGAIVGWWWCVTLEEVWWTRTLGPGEYVRLVAVDTCRMRTGEWEGCRDRDYKITILFRNSQYRNIFQNTHSNWCPFFERNIRRQQTSRLEQHRFGCPAKVVGSLGSGSLVVMCLATVCSWLRPGLELTVAGLTKCVFHRKELGHWIWQICSMTMYLWFKRDY